jgi:serine O-acetyltransferase
MIIYRYGAWSLTLTFKPWRYVNTAIYLVLNQIIGFATKVYIERSTKVGGDLHLVHATMIQIHPDARIGDRCGIMHNVTIGTNTYNSAAPVIGNDVFIGCGASILGAVEIGDDARIAANSLVISDVPSGAVAMGVPAKVIAGMAQLRVKQAVQKEEAATDTNIRIFQEASNST